MSTVINKPMDNRLFNIDLLILNKDNSKYLKEVNKLNIFENNTNNFEESGLYSQSIFGPIGTKERMNNIAVIDLGIGILHPLIFQTLSSLKRLYGEIMSGSKYAVFKADERDFVLSTKDDGETGMAFFLKHLPELKLEANDSDQRLYRVGLVNKYIKPDALNYRWVVLPAGMRDYIVDENGVPSEDEVNDMYRRLMIYASTLKNITLSGANIKLVDNTRYKMQMLISNIFDHFKNILEGKSGFIQNKWAKRAITYGTRNVITASPVSISDLNDPDRITMNNTIVGLYQYCKAITPITLNKVHTRFINKIMDANTNNALLVNKTTLKSEMVEIDIKDRDEWLSQEGLVNILNKIGQEDIRPLPVTISDHYLLLLHDTGDNITVYFDTKNIPDGVNISELRPITYAELFYIAIFDITSKYPAFVTRYPVTGLGSIYPTFPYVKTTIVGRTIKLTMDGVGDDKVVKEYPIAGNEYVNSIGVHYTAIPRLGADFDGDTVGFNIVFSDESILEIKNKLNSKDFYLDTNGNLTQSIDNNVLKLVLAHMTDN